MPGTPKDMLISKALETGVFFHKGPVLGNGGGRSFPRAFERSKKFLFIRRTFRRKELERQVKDGSGNWQLSP